MVINARSIQIKAGKEKEALEWSKEIVQYMKDNLDISVQTLQPLFGSDMDRMTWVGTYDNLAEYEKQLKRVDEDEGVKERLKNDLFEPHSFQSQMYQVVE